MSSLSCDAKITGIKKEEGGEVLILDRTVFYPQGGGQPSDIGVIKSGSALFRVEHVRYCGGLVEHIGEVISGDFNIDESVSCSVSEKDRFLHARLHSAGHLIDFALQKMNVDWIPGKGYHFPAGSYVEYLGDLDQDEKELFIKDLELNLSLLIAQDYKSSITFDESRTQNSKPLRTVYYGDFGIECGGTHVSSLLEIGRVKIRKIKSKKGVVRISYALVDCN